MAASKRLLIVEDEPSLAEALCLVLTAEGFETTIAGNGSHALSLMEETRPDLIITDHMMPIMDGATLATCLRGHPQYAAIPIVVTTAVSEDLMHRHPDCFDAYLRKPYEIEALFETVWRLLG